MRDKSFRAPALTLILLTPVLTELLSGNIPAPRFFLPWVYAFLAISYGLPAIVLRELYVRWNLKLPGLFLLGMAYGIFNEGLLAQTLLQSDNVPINAFDHYTWLGVNFPWATLIVPWHAFHAIVFPVALVTWWFPRAARAEWVSRGTFWSLAVFLTLFGAVLYLGNRHGGSAVYLGFFAAVMALMIGLAWQTRERWSVAFLALGGIAGWRPVMAGVLLYPALVLGLSMCAGFKLPGVAIDVASVLLLTFYFRWIRRAGWLGLTPFALLALGDYLSGTLLTGLFELKSFPVGPGTSLILAALFVWQIRAILKSGDAWSEGDKISGSRQIAGRE